MAKYLITGGAGFFGSILKEILINKGYEIVSIDLEPDSFEHKNFKAIQGDIRNIDTLEKIFQEHTFDGIFHFAALLAHVKKDYKDLWSSNVEGTKNIALMAKKYNVKKVIFTSTNCLWGKNFDMPVTEEEQPEPIEIYGKSKYEGEKILLNDSDSFDSIIFRCPTIIDEGRLGLLGILFQFIDENRKIWMVGDGNNKYQFIYAKDLATACLAALNYNKSEIFNIGSDNVKSFNQVYEYVIKNANSKSQLIHTPKAFMEFCMNLTYKLGISPLGPYQQKMISSNFIFDTSKIKQKLGFQPTLTNEEMLFKSYNYYHENKDEILNRKNVSAHKSVAEMGIIKLIKLLS